MKGAGKSRDFQLSCYYHARALSIAGGYQADISHYRDLPGWFPGSVVRLGYSFVFMLVVLFVGVVIFNRIEKIYIETV